MSMLNISINVFQKTFEQWCTNTLCTVPQCHSLQFQPPSPLPLPNKYESNINNIFLHLRDSLLTDS